MTNYYPRNDGRTLVADYKEGSAVVEVYETSDPERGISWLTFKTCREYVSDGERKRGPFLPDNEAIDLAQALLKASNFMSQRRREIRNHARKQKED